MLGLGDEVILKYTFAYWIFSLLYDNRRWLSYVILFVLQAVLYTELYVSGAQIVSVGALSWFMLSMDVLSMNALRLYLKFVPINAVVLCGIYYIRRW